MFPSHPAWYVNLARRPDDVSIEVDGHRIAVRADSLQTDREIPVVRLTPRR